MSLADEIAAEHVAHARRQGLTPREVLALIGVRWVSQPTWDDVRAAVARRWIELQSEPARALTERTTE